MTADRLKLVLPYVFELVQKLAAREPLVKEVYLFGSFAGGTPSRTSDIDIFVLVEDIRMEKEARLLASGLDLEMEKAGLAHVFSITADTTLDTSLLQGSIAVWKRVVFAGDKKPMAIVEYGLEGLSQSQKNRISRVLYGYSTKKKGKLKKVYVSTVEGLVKKTGAVRLGESILVDEGHANEMADILKKLGAKVKVRRGDLQQT